MKRFLALCLLAVGCLVPANASAAVGFNVTALATSGAPNDIAVGELDGHNGPDIVASVGETLQVMLNNGNGTFAPAVTYPTGCPTYQVELADVTTTGTDLATDGKLDAVVLCVKNGGDLKQIGRMPGNGAGGFGPISISGINPGYLSLNTYLEQSFALASLRAPGLPPVPVFSYSTGLPPNYETLFCYSYDWNGNECLSGFPNISTPIIAGEVAQARVFTLGGEKGILDWGADSTWHWSTRELAPDLSSTAGNSKSMVIGDLAGDGPDIISASGSCGCGYKDTPPAGVVDISYGTNAVGVPDQVGTKIPSAPGVLNIATGDFDLDGHTDLIGTSWSADPVTEATIGSVFVQTGNGVGGLAPPQMFPLSQGDPQHPAEARSNAPIRVADLDGNGGLDAVAIVAGKVQVLLNTQSKVLAKALDPLAGLKGLPKKVQVDKKGNIILGTATNPPTASVELTVLLPGGKSKSGKGKPRALALAKPKGKGKKKGTVIGHAKITIPVGKVQVLKVHLKPKALAKLKKGPLHAKLTIVAVATDGGKATQTQSLTIKPPKKKKKAKKH